jgi:glycosyltransferase involved in cell wall biosynthesis
VGVPVVVTQVGGVPEVVCDGVTGLLVAPASETALQRAIKRLATDPDLSRRLGAAGQARVLADFTLDRMARRVEQVYTELARRKIRSDYGT